MSFSRVETAAGACERMGERSWSSYHRHVQYVLGESSSAGTERVSLLSCNALIRSHLQLHTFLRLHLRDSYPPLMLNRVIGPHTLMLLCAVNEHDLCQPLKDRPLYLVRSTVADMQTPTSRRAAAFG